MPAKMLTFLFVVVALTAGNAAMHYVLPATAHGWPRDLASLLIVVLFVVMGGRVKEYVEKRKRDRLTRFK